MTVKRLRFKTQLAWGFTFYSLPSLPHLQELTFHYETRIICLELPQVFQEGNLSNGTFLQDLSFLNHFPYKRPYYQLTQMKRPSLQGLLPYPLYKMNGSQKFLRRLSHNLSGGYITGHQDTRRRPSYFLYFLHQTPLDILHLNTLY